MSIKKKILSFLEETWAIGIVNTPLNEIISNSELDIKLVKHSYHDRWFADPFVLDVTEKTIELLVEEYFYPKKRGRIAKLTIDRETLSLTKNVTILELNSHLSFPAILRKGSLIYIYPENSASGKLVLYSYNAKTEECKPICILVEEPLTDAIIYYQDNGEPKLFSTKVPKMQHFELGIYSIRNNRFVFDKNYKFKDRISRGAGDFFHVEGNLYRPAQEFKRWYGRGLSIQKVSFNNDIWSFTEIRRIHSNVKGYKDGIHTLNSYNGVTVVDVKRFNHPLLRPFAQLILDCYLKTKILMAKD